MTGDVDDERLLVNTPTRELKSLRDIDGLNCLNDVGDGGLRSSSVKGFCALALIEFDIEPFRGGVLNLCQR